MIDSTDNPQERAIDIADHEAEIVWRETHDYDAYCTTRRTVFADALRELAGVSECEVL